MIEAVDDEGFIDYALAYQLIANIVGDLDIGKRDITIKFPDALDKLIFRIFRLPEPMQEEDNDLFMDRASKYPEYFGPHGATLIRVRLIQLGYLTKPEDV